MEVRTRRSHSYSELGPAPLTLVWRGEVARGWQGLARGGVLM